MRNESMQKKAVGAVRVAMRYLEKTFKALVDGNKVNASKLVWYVIAEVEYGLFLLSLLCSVEELPPKIETLRINPSKRQVEAGPHLVLAEDMLREVESLIKAKNFCEAYGEMRAVRDIILDVHRALSKNGS